MEFCAETPVGYYWNAILYQMKYIHYLFIFLFLTNCKTNQKLTEKKIPDNIKVEINRNIESIGIVLALSDLGDFVLKQADENNNYEFIRLIRKHFGKFKTHPAVLNFNELNQLNLAHFNHFYYGLSYSELPEFKRIYPRFDEFYASEKFDKKEVDSLLHQFDLSIIEFYKDADIERFLNDNKKIYARIAAEIKDNIPVELLPIMEGYFKIYHRNYTIIPSLAIPINWNFGVDIKSKKGIIYNYLTGPYHDLKIKPNEFHELEKVNNLGFNDKKEILDLAIHEFGHSFVRFIDKEKNKKLWESLSYLNNNTLQKNFKKIGEGTDWHTIFEEHLVRANEIMIWREMGNDKTADEKLDFEYKVEGILYIKDFVNSLEKYRINKTKYKNFEEYFPELISDLAQIKRK